MIRAIGVLLVLAMILAIAGLLACGAAPPTPADDATSAAYGLRMNACTFAAKAMDASATEKRANADACMCAVARDAGQADDPVLHCEGGAS